MKLRFVLSDKDCKQLHSTTLSMQIIHAINANLYLSIYCYCHDFWTCLSQHELGLRQKEVLPQGCILLPSSNLLPSSSCFSHGKHSGHRSKVCSPTEQGQGRMETKWPPLPQNSGKRKVCTGARRRYRHTTVKTTAPLDQTLGPTAGYQI